VHREGWRRSLALIQLIREKKTDGYASALTIAIIYFLRARVSTEKDVREDERRAVHNFNIVDLTHNVITNAFEEGRIEDAVQFHSAKEAAKVFITRNKRHFEKVKDEIEVLTPEEFLRKYKAQ
jgi:predicted nucleic acid-binding protein